MKSFRSTSVTSLLCLLVICAFCAPAFAMYPWAEDPPGKTEISNKPFNSGWEPGNLIGKTADKSLPTVTEPQPDPLSAVMYEFTFYMYDLLTGSEDGNSVAPDPQSRK